MSKEKLPLTVKSGYGVGDLVAGLAFQTINFHMRSILMSYSP